MKVSLTGLLRRLKGRKDQLFAVEEFIKHYKQAKNSFQKDEEMHETLTEFFNIYVTEND